MAVHPPHRSVCRRGPAEIYDPQKHQRRYGLFIDDDPTLADKLSPERLFVFDRPYNRRLNGRSFDGVPRAYSYAGVASYVRERFCK